MAVTVDLARCDGNGECVKACAFSAVEVRDSTAVIFDNCTDCGACVLACRPKALWSDLFSSSAKTGVLAVDFSASSGIAGVVERAARASDVSAVWMLADPLSAGFAADAIAAAAKDGAYSLVVFPHVGAGPAIAARVAARLEANLVAGCSEFRLEESGGGRGVRPHFGGIVKAPVRWPAGATVVTVYPRAISNVVATPVATETFERVAAGGSSPAPLAEARRVVSVGAGLTPDAQRAARAFAVALGAITVDPAAVGNRALAPDLYVAFGVDGSTEHNSAFRNSRVVVAVVKDAAAPISQIADYLLVGDVAEHAQALLAAM
jgi:electron transfer flavoprotein alpha subunit